MNTLTNSATYRQNILNNQYALEQVRQHLNIGGTQWEGELAFTKPQVAEILEVDERTIERYLNSHAEELQHNGYRLLEGDALRRLKEEQTDIHVGLLARSVGLFSFRAVLNLAMLVQESERAKAIRSRILDIVVDVIAARTGGNTKYINQRDEDYIFTAYRSEQYQAALNEALRKHVTQFPNKYDTILDLIYQSIFQENAQEYRRILNLAQQDNERDTFYVEVLDVIASYENGLAHEITKQSQQLVRKLNAKELRTLFADFETHPLFKPLIERARTVMASRDWCFRDALHERLEHYIGSVPREDFERFLGEKSKELSERLKETQNVFKRLKDR